MRTLKTIVFLLFMLIFISLCSCSASWHIKRAMVKDPSMFKDTVRVEKIDTILIETPKVDTLFKQQRDTLIEYIQGDVKIKYLWNTKTDSVYIEADCPDQEIIERVVTKTVPPIVLKPTFWQQARWAVIILFLIGVIFLLRKITE